VQDQGGWAVVAVTLKGRRKPLAKHGRKDYFCSVVSEDVEIALKIKPFPSRKSKDDMFVQCNQLECQYVDINQSPCPLHLDLFAKEIEKREEKRRDRRMGF
jgi:hypothetical protein